jgi:hypothetical protein
MDTEGDPIGLIYDARLGVQLGCQRSILCDAGWASALSY